MKREIGGFHNGYRLDKIDRRGFLRKLSLLTGATTAAIASHPLLDENHARASEPAEEWPGQRSGNRDHADYYPEMVADDTGLITRFINYPGETGAIRAYLAKPQAEKAYPAVIVIHENRGLQPHIMDVTRRMATEGFLVLAPDALSPYGGTPEDEDITEALRLMRELDYSQTVKDFVAAVQYLETHPLSNGNVGCTGFCWGGAMTNQVAVNAPTLKAAVPYYGSAPPAGQVKDIRASLMAHYASDDPRINAGIPEFKEALEKAGTEYRIYMYEGTQHAFNNNTNPDRYHQEAARLAWERTIAFFRQKLGP